MKAKIQQFGSMMSAMVMPNIGAFIAWGIIAALFIPAGYFPNETLNQLVSPMLTYVLPILIGYTAGFNIYGKRGGVAGAIATVGVIVGSDVTMLIGGMVMGPLGAILIRKFDKMIEGKVKPGFEMLVDNFSVGILGAILMVVGLLVIGPVYSVVSDFLMGAVNFAMDHNILQFTPIFVVPGQVLFLNNAINHGILGPLAIQQAAETGKSILFLIEANGGNWAGLILAYCVFGKGMAKKSAPGALAIVVIGGIGEVAYPYALIKPLTMLGAMAGQICALFWLTIMHGGTVAAVSPGSFIALCLMSPRGGLWINVVAYLIAAVVSFVICSAILKADKTPDEEEEAYEGSAPQARPAVAAAAASTADSADTAAAQAAPVSYGKRKIEKVVFACDAGMGSSVMGASMLKNQFNKLGLDLAVDHVSLNDLTEDIDVIVTSVNLYERALKQAPEGVPVIKIENFLDGAEQKRIAQTIRDMMTEQ